MTRSVSPFCQWVHLLEAEYRGVHQAPSHKNGDPFYDVSRTIYPDDFYEPNGLRYYGTGNTALDSESYRKIVMARNKPEFAIEIYRSIPKSVPQDQQRINPGDWVTPSRTYAKEHGYRFPEGMTIISKKVPAKHLFTDGNSMHEWGYDPT